MWNPYPVLSLLLLCSCCWAERDPIVQTKYGKVSTELFDKECLSIANWVSWLQL